MIEMIQVISWEVVDFTVELAIDVLSLPKK